MKKRSLKLLMLLAVIYAAASSFVSCKDNYSDDFSSIHYEVATLDEAVALQAQALAQLSSELESYKASVKTEIDGVKTLIADLSGSLNDFKGSTDVKFAELYEKLAALETEYQEINIAIQQINATLADYETKIAKNATDIATLQGLYTTLNSLVQELSGRLSIVENNITNVYGKIDSLGNVVVDFKTDIYHYVDSTNNVLVDFINVVNGKVSDLGVVVVDLDKKVENYNKALNARIDSIIGLMPASDSKINALSDSIHMVNGIAQLALDYAIQHESVISELAQKFANYYTKADIDAMMSEAKAATEKAQKAADDANKLAEDAYKLADEANKLAGEAMAKAKANETKIAANATEIAANKTKIADLEKAMKDADKELADKISALDTRLTKVEGDVAKLIEDLGILQDTVDNIKNDIAKMIVGVTYQGIVNPVIGQFSLPVGLENNMLFAWYGKNTGGDQKNWPNNHLEPSDLDMIGSHGTFGFEAGDVFVADMDKQKAYLGRVYTTINPNTVDFAGQNLKIVDSQDNECGAYLEPLKNSDELLQFGFTRDVKNGFYEADAWIDYDKVESVRLTKNLDKTQIKEALKTTLSGLKANLKGNSAELGIATLYKTFMDNISCVIPQYGLKASWLDSESAEHSVYSKYGLAVTSIKPASFDFLKDYKTPKIPLISDISFDVEFKLDSVHYDPIDAPTKKLNIYVVYKNIKVYSYELSTFIDQQSVIGVFSKESDAEACVSANPGAEYYKQEFTVSEFQEFVDDINNGLIKNVNKDVNKLIDQIASQTQANVNKALGKVNTKVIARVNKVITKINNRLADLNHYLQPIALYSSERLKNGSWVTEWHPLSNNWLVPSPVNCPAGGGYVQIEPTTMTAESVCPCYRKFVAVTNAFKEDYSTSAKAGNAACKAALDEANKPAPDALNNLGVHSMKTVYSDNQDLVFAVQPGYVYEIAYVALDYSGKTCVHKYYVKAHNY